MYSSFPQQEKHAGQYGYGRPAPNFGQAARSQSFPIGTYKSNIQYKVEDQNHSIRLFHLPTP